jgi:hypothetical protein
MDETLISVSLKNVATVTIMGLVGLAIWHCAAKWLKSRNG